MMAVAALAVGGDNRHRKHVSSSSSCRRDGGRRLAVAHPLCLGGAAGSLARPRRQGGPVDALVVHHQHPPQGGDCVFESEAAPPKDAAQRPPERRHRAQPGPRRVQVSAKDPEGGWTPVLATLCESELKAVAEVCSLDGAAVLLDDRSRFRPRPARATCGWARWCSRRSCARRPRRPAAAACRRQPVRGRRANAYYESVASDAHRAVLQCMRGACRRSCAGSLPTQAELQAMDCRRHDDLNVPRPRPRAPAPKPHKKTRPTNCETRA